MRVRGRERERKRERGERTGHLWSRQEKADAITLRAKSTCACPCAHGCEEEEVQAQVEVEEEEEEEEGCEFARICQATCDTETGREEVLHIRWTHIHKPKNLP